jgi:hypothetical protein
MVNQRAPLIVENIKKAELEFLFCKAFSKVGLASVAEVQDSKQRKKLQAEHDFTSIASVWTQAIGHTLDHHKQDMEQQMNHMLDQHKQDMEQQMNHTLD